ncbi:uncharacterized protein LOC118439115 [Folsomia candida]|uniref:uncharacterized protein LOC118439115 n=1 Tax=Folsomia candida TaxID=158441 RepID=UPI001604E1BC|nr:uncharacterized protein LOC118439115 [Folsomia candida]
MLRGEKSEGGDSKYGPDNEDNSTASHYSEPTLIPDVIPHVCKFLGIRAIKKCQLVCRSWNYEATPVLKARTLTNIRLDSGNCDNRHRKEWRLDGRMEEKLGFNTYLKFSSYKSTLAPTDLETFPSVRNVKSIVVHFYIWEDWQRDLCDKIILSSSPTLEELKYEWFFDQEFVPCTGTVFPKLKKLVIDCRLFDSQCPRNPPLKMVGKAITESFPALEVLKIDCNNLYEISNVEMLQKFPLQIT